MAPEVRRNKQVIFKAFIVVGAPKEEHMDVKEGSRVMEVAPGSGDVLVKNLYLSCDPYMRGRMRENYSSYIPPFAPGSVIEGFGVCKVVASDDRDFHPGDVLSGITGWEEYSLISAKSQMRKIAAGDDDIPLSYHVGLLGMPGFTAYAGINEICRAKKGETFYVSAAAGAVGQIAGQLAKRRGCYVVGSAGSDRKVELLKGKLGFDDAFNYNSLPEEGGLEAELRRRFPSGIDVYFDNVGGETLDAALANMRVKGRVAVCGMVTQHAAVDPEGIHNLFYLVSRRIRMEGFLQSDHLDLFPRFSDEVAGLLRRREIVYVEDVSDGIDTAPAAFVGLFSGRNVGKQVVCVAKE